MVSLPEKKRACSNSMYCNNMDIHLLPQGNSFFAKTRFTSVRNLRSSFSVDCHSPGDSRAQSRTRVWWRFLWGTAKPWDTPICYHRCRWSPAQSTAPNGKGYLEWNVWRETKETQLSNNSCLFTGLHLERIYKVTQSLFVCSSGSPNSMAPHPSQATKTTPFFLTKDLNF